MKNFLNNIPSILLTLLFVLGINAYAQTGSWTAPTGSFPNNNVNPPIHSGLDFQNKDGVLQAGGFKSDFFKSNDYFSVNMTDGSANGFCFGKTVGGSYDPTALGCVTSWDDLGGTTVEGIDPGNENDTLRFDGSSWVSDSFLQNTGAKVSVLAGSIAGQAPDYDVFFEAVNNTLGANFSVLDTKGLRVLGNGITWTDGGFFSEGPAHFWGDTTLRRTAVESGSQFSGYNADFQWGGDDGNADGNFWVGTKAEFEGGLKISSGNPGEGKVLTSDAQGNASWRDPAQQSGFSINTRIATGGANCANCSASAWCDSNLGEYLVGGGASCEGASLLRESYPASTVHWTARCQGDGVDVYAICMRNGQTAIQAPEPVSPTPSWHALSGTIGGQFGQSCLDLINSSNLFPQGTTATLTNVATGNTSSGVGKCWYATGPTLFPQGLRSADTEIPFEYSSSTGNVITEGWRPVITNVAGATYLYY